MPDHLTSPDIALSSRPNDLSGRAWLRFAWELLGPIALAALLVAPVSSRILVSLIQVGWFSYPLLVSWLVLGVRMIAMTAAGGHDAPWVPRRWTTFVAMAIPLLTSLVCWTHANPDDILPSYYRYYGVEFQTWDTPEAAFVTGMLLLGVCAVMMLHAEAAASRSRSGFLGWLLALPFIGFVCAEADLIDVLRSVSPSSIREELGTPEVFVQLTFQTGAGILYGWTFAMVVELVAGGALRWRFWRGPHNAALRPATLPTAVGLSLLPCFVIRLILIPVAELVQQFTFGASIVIIPLLHLLSAPVIFLVGLALGKWALRSDEGRPTAARLAPVYVAATLGTVLAIFRALTLRDDSAWIHPVEGTLLWVVLGLLVLLDMRVVHTAQRKSHPGGGPVFDDTIPLRLLALHHRSPLRAWGAKRTRISLPLMILLAWGITFLVMLLGLRLGVRQRLVRNVDFAEIFTFQDPWDAFWVAFLTIVYSAGVVYVWLWHIPWRVASRFHQVWNALQLRELYLTRMHPWEIFLGVALSPVRRWILFLAANVVLCMGVLYLWHVQAPPGSQWELSARIAYATLPLVPVLAGLLLNLFVIGITRGTRFKGLAAFGVAWVVVIVSFLGVLSAISLIELGMRDTYFVAFLFAYVTFLFAWAGWQAFRGVPKELERIVGE